MSQSTTSTPPPGGTERAAGLRRLTAGGVLGLAGGLLAVAIPVGLAAGVRWAPGGALAWSSNLLLAGGVLILAGAILLVLSFLAYRRAFARLRTVDRRFLPASLLCLLGTLGFVLLVVAAAVAIGDASGLLGCVSGAPTRALACVRDASPLGAYTAVAGFALSWLGSLGLVLGLGLAGTAFRRRSFTGAAVLYAVLLLALVGPFLALLVTVPGVGYFLLVAPLLAVVAPAFVLAGGRD